MQQAFNTAAAQHRAQFDRDTDRYLATAHTIETGGVFAKALSDAAGLQQHLKRMRSRIGARDRTIASLRKKIAELQAAAAAASGSRVDSS